ncbi:MAG: transcription antitermination factor NusB [Planctomycetota bacterium]
MSRRTRAREIVLQVLYQEDLNPEQPADVRIKFIHARLNHDRSLVKFATQLLDGIEQHKAALDRKLELTARNWRLKRMSATDRNVLRLGAFEILFTETPDRVAVNEAIELAKRYGTNNSAQFVNGVLDRLMHQTNDDVLDSKPQDEPPSPQQTT